VYYCFSLLTLLFSKLTTALRVDCPYAVRLVPGILLISIISSLTAQPDSLSIGTDKQPWAYYWVGFTDKSGSPYSISDPSAFLSPRAIKRRLDQGIAINEHDLPVNPHYVAELLGLDFIEYRYSSRWFNGILIRSGAGMEAMNSLLSKPFVNNIRLVKPPLGKDEPAGKTVPLHPLKQLNTVGQTADTSLCGMYRWTKTEGAGESMKPSVSLVHSAMEAIMASGPGYTDIAYMGQFPAMYGESEVHFRQLAADYLHSRGYTGEGLRIAILDAGFTNVNNLVDVGHLYAEGRLLGTRDFVDAGENIYGAHPHGTYVLSVMAAKNPGRIWGSAVDASYWLIRTEDAASEYLIEEYNWLAGAEFADSAGVDIINSSLGYTRFQDASTSYTYADMNGQSTVTARAANMAFERGMLVVASAGNYGNDPGWRYIGSPADANGALAVGAVDNNREKVGFSSVGPSADGRVKPEVMAMGRLVPAIGPDNSAVFVSGTSFSSPIIAGLAACLWQMFPGITAADLKNVITKSADRFHLPDSLYGYGIPNFQLAANLIAPVEPSTLLSVFPNPLQSNSCLSFFSETAATMQLDWLNMKGQTVMSLHHIPVQPGYNRIFPFQNLYLLPNGIYLLRLFDLDREYFVKCIVLHN